jgi:hypothetical protein
MPISDEEQAIIEQHADLVFDQMRLAKDLGCRDAFDSSVAIARNRDLSAAQKLAAIADVWREAARHAPSIRQSSSSVSASDIAAQLIRRLRSGARE